ncbi:regulatory protein, luxR family [Amycolatopsis marina]|uniref:Regulatory protein, luxR family n=1 Tax=Amycolatopsis marina TaxID=490629 RepID=A0A1I1ARY9_9PSEU|nr:helix-turn-helix transcriptional regulator [Amycolatopsis marina]SFB40272.1 regulatory protein, luxR family [Amycolatopsis marina]
MTLTNAGKHLPHAVRQAERALSDSRCLRNADCVFDALTGLVLAGELVIANDAVTHLEHLGRPDSSFTDRLTLVRGRTARRLGDLDTAWNLYESLHTTVSDPALRPTVVAETTELLRDRGEPVAARAVLTEHGVDRRGREPPRRPELLCARGAITMAAGDFGAALADLLACGQKLLRRGVLNPASSPWRRRAAWCAHLMGNARLATELAEKDHNAALLWGEPRTIGLALATLAVVTGAENEIELLSESTELLETAGAGFELGEISYGFGRKLVHNGQQAFAREQFNKAVAQFRRSGNLHRTARAEAELAQLSTPPEAELTRNEMRIASLAAVGYSNRDIAAKQFLAVRTVECHLSQIYRKLGLRSRDELRTRMFDQVGTSVPDTTALPYVPGGIALAAMAGAPSPERACALRAVMLANQGSDRADVVRDAVFVLQAPDGRDLLSFWCAVLALFHAGATDLAAQHCDRAAATPHPDADEVYRECVTALRGRLAWLHGDPATAADLLRGVADRNVHPPLRDLLTAWQVAASIDLGDLDEAHSLMLKDSYHPSAPDFADAPELFAALGSLELAAQRHDIARAAFLASGSLLTAAGVRNPAVIPWRSQAALCADATGRRRLAVVLANRELMLARRWSDTRTVGVATHACAVVVGRTPDDVREAADILADCPARGEFLRARYDYAQFLSSARRYGEARAVLRTVGDHAAKYGYRRWSDQAKATLHRLTQQARTRLTTQECKIAELARAGLSNRRIAEQQRLTLRTVEFHLSSVYRKLGISGRRELAIVRTPAPDQPEAP